MAEPATQTTTTDPLPSSPSAVQAAAVEVHAAAINQAEKAVIPADSGPVSKGESTTKSPLSQVVSSQKPPDARGASCAIS